MLILRSLPTDSLAASPFTSGNGFEVIVLPKCDLAVKYRKSDVGNVAIRPFFNPKTQIELLASKSSHAVELYQDFSMFDRAGDSTETVLLCCYSPSAITTLKKVNFSSDFNTRNEYQLSKNAWSKEKLCKWAHVAPDTCKLITDYAIYDVHSKGKTMTFDWGTRTDPIFDYHIVFWKIGNEISWNVKSVMVHP